MKKLLVSLLLMGAACVYAENPVYIDANVGYMSAPYNTYSYNDGVYSGTAGSNGSVAFNFNAGYLFNQYFALEGGFTTSPLSYDSIKICYKNSCVNSNTPTGNYYAFDVAAKGILPLNDIFALYGKAGLSYNRYNASLNGQTWNTTSGGFLMGVGAKFNLTNQWSLHVEDNYTALFNPTDQNGYANSNLQNPNIVMAGAEFRF